MQGKVAPLILYIAPLCVALGVGFQLLRRWRNGRRPRVYEKLCRDLSLHVCEPGSADIPELRATTQHACGRHEGYRVRIFENVSDLVEPGYPTATQTYILLAKPHWELPRFLIEPRTMATNLRQKIERRKGIFFPKDEAFTTACFVDGPDHVAIRAALTPRAMRLLRGNRHTYVDCRGDALLLYESETLLSANGVRRLLDLAIALANGLAKR